MSLGLAASYAVAQDSECTLGVSCEDFWLGLPRDSNHALVCPEYPRLRTIGALLKGIWGISSRGPTHRIEEYSDYPRASLLILLLVTT